MSLSLHRHRCHRDLHSFPTRRSSDLLADARWAEQRDGFAFGHEEVDAVEHHVVHEALRDVLQLDAHFAVPRMSFVRIERSEEHTSELQSPMYLVCRLLLEKKNIYIYT